jgi:site-specific recombinase XerD
MGQFHDLMDRDLRIRGYGDTTREVYLNAVRNFVRFAKRSPDQLTIEDVNRYQLHLTRDRQVSWSHFNVVVCAIRFFYNVSLQKEWDIRRIPYRKTGRKLPEILSPDEVGALLAAPNNLKHRALLATVYATGVRRNEVVHLKITDIDSSRMVVHVRQGKGRKDRDVMLSPQLLALLREYWKAYRPSLWLFPGRDPQTPYAPKTLRHILDRAKRLAGSRPQVTLHTLRHCFATHLMEQGANLRVIQKLLGHRSLRTTEIYTHVAKTSLENTPSPFDALPLPKLSAARGSAPQ